MNWRERFNSLAWDWFYVLDTHDVGIRRAKEEKRVTPCGQELRRDLLKIIEEAIKESKTSE